MPCTAEQRKIRLCYPLLPPAMSFGRWCCGHHGSRCSSFGDPWKLARNKVDCFPIKFTFFYRCFPLGKVVDYHKVPNLLSPKVEKKIKIYYILYKFISYFPMNLVMFSQKKTQNLRLFEHDLQGELIRFGHMFRQGCQPQLPAVPRLETVETWGEFGCFQEIYVENGMNMAWTWDLCKFLSTYVLLILFIVTQIICGTFLKGLVSWIIIPNRLNIRNMAIESTTITYKL